MKFDPRTLFLVHALTSLALGGMLFAFWRAHRTMSCLALWAGGATLIGIRMALITVRGEVPDLVSIVVANSLGVAGVIVVWNGVRVFNAKKPRWRAALVALPLLAAALAYWTYVQNDLAMRAIIVNGMLTVVSLVCAYELLRPRSRPLRRAAIIAGAPFLLNAIASAASVLLALRHAPASNLMTAGLTSLLLVPLVANTVAAIGFIMMTAELSIQQRSDLEAQLFESQKMEALGTLAGGIAHDLNNTLVPVLALAKMTAARLPQGSRERNNLQTIFKASERASALVQQMLAFSRKETATLETVDLAQVARDALTLLRGSVPSTITIEERIGAVPTVLGDGGKLHQVIANLVANAAKAIGDERGTIAVELAEAPGERLPHDPQRPPGSVIRLTVIDTGCGMDQATAARMFEPFFTTRPAGAGTGLGLSVVHGIIDQHGGRVSVESKVGGGTRVDVYLPALADTARAVIRFWGRGTQLLASAN